MAEHKDDEKLVDVTPHLGACALIILLGVATGNWRVIDTALLTLVAFCVFLALVAGRWD